MGSEPTGDQTKETLSDPSDPSDPTQQRKEERTTDRRGVSIAFRLAPELVEPLTAFFLRTLSPERRAQMMEQPRRGTRPGDAPSLGVLLREHAIAAMQHEASALAFEDGAAIQVEIQCSRCKRQSRTRTLLITGDTSDIDEILTVVNTGMGNLRTTELPVVL